MIEDHEYGSLLEATLEQATCFLDIISAEPQLMTLARAAFRHISDPSPSDEDLRRLVEVDAYNGLLTALETRASHFGEALGPPRVRVCPSNLETVTTDERRFIGLHVDEHFSGKYNNRSSRPSRLVFNLGNSPRYLLFLPVTVEAIRRWALSQGAPETEHGTTMGRYFMESHPDFPVVRLRLDPGEAYLAPTENLVHDGSSVGGSGADISAHLLGTFFMRGLER